MYSCNEFHKVLQPIALSNTRFYEKILGKYQRNKKKSSGFQQLLFCKINDQTGLQKININFLYNLYLQNSFSCSLEGLEKMVRIFQYPEKRKLTPYSGIKNLYTKNLQIKNGKNIKDKNEEGLFSARKKTHHERSPTSAILIPLLSSNVNASGRIKRTVSPLKLIFFPSKPVVSIVENTVPGTKLFVPWLKTRGSGVGPDNTVLVHSTSAIKNIIPGLSRKGYRNVERLAKTLPLSTLSPKKIEPINVNEAVFKKAVRDQRAISIYFPNRHPALTYNSKPEPALSRESNLVFGKNGYLGQATGSLYFFNQQQIDQDLQQIKKTMSKMEKSVSERLRSVSNPEQSNLKRDSDISSISEQVYRTIERRIIMEKEMRGL